MLEPGDICPDWNLKGPRGEQVSLISPPMAGRYNIFVVSGGPRDILMEIFSRISEKRGDIEKMGVRPFLIESPSVPANRPVLAGLGVGNISGQVGSIYGEHKAGAMKLIDCERVVHSQLGRSQDTSLLVTVAANQHILSILTLSETEKKDDVKVIIDSLLDSIQQQSERRATFEPGIHPPVLTVPDVLSQSDCCHLIEIFRTRGNEFVQPGHMMLGDRKTDCKMRIPDQGREDRVDHWVVERETQNFISEKLQSRLFPEIKKAFNYKITRHERYRIARYEGKRGGEKIGHRDNNEPNVAHRRFAVTVNLNAADYEGAELRFPEFSSQLYKPASGTAIVFSCSLLHEVVEMRCGARFALLGFLFGDI